MLNVIELHFDYLEQPLLQGIDIHLPEGGLLHIKGENGAGKTTLLKLLAGLFQPHSGHIQFDGVSIYSDRTHYQNQLCFVGHRSGVSPFLNVRESCYFDLHYDASRHTIDELLAVFGLQAHADKPATLLSAGQLKQVSLLRLWMSNARLWLLDEPLVALDPLALTRLMNKIKQHRSQGGAVILTSHQPLPLDASDYEEYSL